MAASSFHISTATDLLGRWVTRCPNFWIKLGNLESDLLADELADIAIREPVYVCGLARGGTTLLLEMLASGEKVSTHRYSDFPWIFTPYWLRTLQRFNPIADRTKRERAHGDKMMVSPQSPEAMEEMLWAGFFPQAHDPQYNAVLDASSAYPSFERFYRQHIQKLLLASRGARYLAKGNYNLTRMGYLQRLFPDARFILAVREPAAHIASLRRQHARFCEAAKDHPRVTEHLKQAGHFEFGPARIPIHCGDDTAIAEIMQAWKNGEEIRGWALYWAMLYRFVHRQREAMPELKKNMLVVRFEDMCASPAQTLDALLEHTHLNMEPAARERWAEMVRTPDYYSADFTNADLQLIRSITQETAAFYGY